ncbi:hypothetical protein C8R43DRAFT_1229459 [Mycena crocata]|nr:hypothetical protein C8R43DRAFT_1229459 [Mycena crocata]
MHGKILGSDLQPLLTLPVDRDRRAGPVGAYRAPGEGVLFHLRVRTRLGEDLTVDPTQPEWPPTSAQRDLERQARNSPSEELITVIHHRHAYQDSLRGMGSSCPSEQSGWSRRGEGQSPLKTDSKIQQPEAKEQGPQCDDDSSSSPPRNRRVVDLEMTIVLAQVSIPSGLIPSG